MQHGAGEIAMLGERLRALRKQNSLTQQNMAVRLGTAKSTISQYETGVNQPDHDTLVRLANLFQVSLDYLLGRSDNPGMAIQPCNAVYFGGAAVDLSDDEAEYLRESLEVYRRLKVRAEDAE